MIDRVTAAYQKSLVGASATKPSRLTSSNELQDDTDELAQLAKVDRAIWSDSDRLATQIQSLQLLASDLSGQDEADVHVSDIDKAVRAELAYWTTIQRVKSQYDYVNACLFKLDSGTVDPASNAAVSILQAADNALPQFWGEDHAQIPEPLSTAIKGYPVQIANWTTKIGAARSQPILVEIQMKCASALSSANQCQKQEDACNLLGQCLKEINEPYAKITSAEIRAKADSSIEELTSAIQAHRKAQYNAYQQWALDKLDQAFKDWDSHHYDSADKAQHIYDDYYQLFEIDPALLSPEVSRVHNDIVTKIFTKLDSDAEVKMSRKTEEQKWGLDRF